MEINRTFVVLCSFAAFIQFSEQKSTYADFKSIFHTPNSKFDDYEILERSNFHSDDPHHHDKYGRGDSPQAIANAQVLLHMKDRDHHPHPGHQPMHIYSSGPQYVNLNSHGGMRHQPSYLQIPQIPPMPRPPMSPPMARFPPQAPMPRYQPLPPPRTPQQNPFNFYSPKPNFAHYHTGYETYLFPMQYFDPNFIQRPPQYIPQEEYEYLPSEAIDLNSGLVMEQNVQEPIIRKKKKKPKAPKVKPPPPTEDFDRKPFGLIPLYSTPMSEECEETENQPGEITKPVGKPEKQEESTEKPGKQREETAKPEEGEATKPKEETATPEEEEAAKPKEEATKPEEEVAAKPKEDTATPEEGEAAKPKEEATKPEEEVAAKPKEETATPEEGEAAKPKEEATKPEEEVAAKPKEETATPEEGEAAKPKEEATKPEEEVASKPKEETATPEEGEAAKPKEEATKPEEEVASKPKEETATTEEGEAAKPKEGEAAKPEEEVAEKPKEETEKQGEQTKPEEGDASEPKEEKETAKPEEGEASKPKVETEKPGEETAKPNEETGNPGEEPAKPEGEGASKPKEETEKQGEEIAKPGGSEKEAPLEVTEEITVPKEEITEELNILPTEPCSEEIPPLPKDDLEGEAKAPIAPQSDGEPTNPKPETSQGEQPETTEGEQPTGTAEKSTEAAAPTAPKPSTDPKEERGEDLPTEPHHEIIATEDPDRSVPYDFDELPTEEWPDDWTEEPETERPVTRGSEESAAEGNLPVSQSPQTPEETTPVPAVAEQTEAPEGASGSATSHGAVTTGSQPAVVVQVQTNTDADTGVPQEHKPGKTLTHAALTHPLVRKPKHPKPSQVAQIQSNVQVGSKKPGAVVQVQTNVGSNMPGSVVQVQANVQKPDVLVQVQTNQQKGSHEPKSKPHSGQKPYSLNKPKPPSFSGVPTDDHVLQATIGVNAPMNVGSGSAVKPEKYAPKNRKPVDFGRPKVNPVGTILSAIKPTIGQALSNVGSAVKPIIAPEPPLPTSFYKPEKTLLEPEVESTTSAEGPASVSAPRPIPRPPQLCHACRRKLRTNRHAGFSSLCPKCKHSILNYHKSVMSSSEEEPSVEVEIPRPTFSVDLDDLNPSSGYTNVDHPNPGLVEQNPPEKFNSQEAWAKMLYLQQFLNQQQQQKEAETTQAPSRGYQPFVFLNKDEFTPKKFFYQSPAPEREYQPKRIYKNPPQHLYTLDDQYVPKNPPMQRYSFDDEYVPKKVYQQHPASKTKYDVDDLPEVQVYDPFTRPHSPSIHRDGRRCSNCAPYRGELNHFYQARH